MNAKTKEAVIKHGEDLLAIFPKAVERDPVKLCRKLRRIEVAAGNSACAYCNGDIDIEGWEMTQRNISKRVAALLGTDRVWINGDPRGYALKVDLGDGEDLHRDWGGYGIIAPDLTAE